MKKKIIVSLLLIFAFSFCTGCSSDDGKVSYDVKKIVGDKAAKDKEDSAGDESTSADIVRELGEKLLSGIKYDDTLSEIDLDTAKMFLNISDISVTDSFIYESSGATAEEIVVLKCSDSDGAVKAKEAFNQRVLEQTDNFTDYVPSEVPKLNDAVIITSKEYAVLCVSSDSGKAKSIIESAFTK